MKLFSYGVYATVLSATVFAADYKPTESPLMTVWGEKMSPDTAWTLYPRPQMERDRWTNLNGLWDYAITKRDAGCPKEWQGKILVPFCIESALSGVGTLIEPAQNLWYHRTFTEQACTGGERLLLNFGAVDFRVQVWLNNAEVTDVPHEAGNTPWSLDITDWVKDGKNELVLCVWDPTEGLQGSGKQSFKPQGCFYKRVTGIWQTVWTERVPDTYVKSYKVVTDIDAGTVAVTVNPEGELLGVPGAKVDVLDQGKVIASGTVTAWKTPVALTIKDAKLWSPETPNLYALRITLGKDHVTGYFGMRKISWQPDDKGVPRLYFNNKRYFMQGTLDQGWWPDGLLTPPSEEAMTFDITKLKSFGFNMMRKHIKVEPARYYYLCDKLGILVWQDMVSPKPEVNGAENGYRQYRFEAKEEMDVLQTFPCIVFWIPYNEGWGQPGKEKTNMTLEWVKRYDPTRLVGGPSGWTDHGVGDTFDMHRYPGPGMHPVSKHRVSILGEFGGIGYAVEGHTWAKNGNWGYVSDTKLEDSFARYTKLMSELADLTKVGLAASIYTQTTDVEGEINGLMTYDRKVVKYDPEKLTALHKMVDAASQKTVFFEYQDILPVSTKEKPLAWSYTFEQPAEGWEKADFDDAAWKKGNAPFRNKILHGNTPTGVEWDTKALWARQVFDFKGEIPQQLALTIFYDEDPVIYLNGVVIFERKGFNVQYDRFKLDTNVMKSALKKGRNVIAVKLVNALGGSCLDLGLQSVSEK